jgi:hypothetical protein
VHLAETPEYQGFARYYNVIRGPSGMPLLAKHWGIA